MIKWPEDDADFDRLIAVADLTIPEYNKRSFRGPQGYQVGIVGELVIMDWLEKTGKNWRATFNTRYDLEVDGEKWEIKTKERTVDPEDWYDCTVPAYNHDHQRADRFVFVSVTSSGKSNSMDRFKRAFILGTITYDELDRRGTHRTPADAPDNNGWVPTIECYNIPITELDQP